MVREYSWKLNVRSYEGDAWGFAPASVMLGYLEQSAVAAASDAGYGRGYTQEHGSAWVIRRMTLLMPEPALMGDELKIRTWLSHFARVRGGREYTVENLTTDKVTATGLAEWVYLKRESLAPMAIPPELAVEFDVPGAPLNSYEPLEVTRLIRQPEFTMQRIADWHEADSMGHVNNAVYANWLDDALRGALEEMGWRTHSLREMGLHLRGEYYNIEYKRAVLPGERVTINTHIEGVEGRLCATRQIIHTSGSNTAPVVTASSVYGWRGASGERSDSPEGWG